MNDFPYLRGLLDTCFWKPKNYLLKLENTDTYIKII